jgi:hypothetical protein
MAPEPFRAEAPANERRQHADILFGETERNCHGVHGLRQHLRRVMQCQAVIGFPDRRHGMRFNGIVIIAGRAVGLVNHECRLPQGLFRGAADLYLRRLAEDVLRTPGARQ